MNRKQKRRKHKAEKQLIRKYISKELYLRNLLKSYNRWLKLFGRYGDPCKLGSALFTRSLPRD